MRSARKPPTGTTEIEETGFAIVPQLLGSQTISWLASEIERVADGDGTKRRGTYGIRDLLNLVPAIRELAGSSCVRSVVESILGSAAQVVRGIFFDKTPEANWKVAWHQDLTISVRQKRECAGFSGWSRKAGVLHVQPPAYVLQEMLTLRLHLDDTDAFNGALKVIPGSHKFGRMSSQEIELAKLRTPGVICEVPAGGALLMRPLLVHASSTSTNLGHRRVIHLDYSAADLPGGLEWYGS